MSAPAINRSLDVLLRPRSVAVIGASRRPESIGGVIFRNLIGSGFQGPVYPVHPASPVVQSVRAYASVGDIPDHVDLAVIVVPQRYVLDVVDECAVKGVRGLVVISAGFGETGPEGRALQQKLLERVRNHGMRMIGPNCLGILNTEAEVQLNATFAPTWPPAGGVAFSSQSGALGLAILDYARELSIGISQFASVGNKADVSGNDLVEYWETDPKTRVILLYLESFGNPRRFMEIARRVSRHKPIIAVKSGRTEAGARAASSHTGSLAGVDVAVDALLGQAGVMRTDTIEELFDLAMLVANQPIPRGSNVAIVTNAGGPGIMASDACESRGLTIAPLSSETRARLREFLPQEASVHNPIDMIASATAESYERALELALGDPRIDSVIVLFVPPIITEASDVAAAIRRSAANATKPVLTCFMGTHGVPAGLSSLREGNIPSYAFPEPAAIALSRAVRYGRWLQRPEGALVTYSDVQPSVAREIVSAAVGDGTHSGEARWLEDKEVRRLLGAYGLRTLRSAFAPDAAAAVAAAEAIGFPVAIKLASATITHKSDVGGVLLGVEHGPGVAEAFDAIHSRLESIGREAEMEGVVVQEMAPSGVETFIGMTQDPAFGPLLGFGIGGVNVELWKDIVFRVQPVTSVDATEMIEQIRGVKLLDGFRGAAPADREAIVDVLLRVNQLVSELPEILELDINPLTALPPGEGAIVVDARIRLRMA